MSLFQLASFIKILLLVMLLIWMHITYFWGDHNTMSMLPIEARETSTCSLQRVRRLPWSLFHLFQSQQKKKSQNLYPYATKVNSWWNQKRQSKYFALVVKEEVTPSIKILEEMKPMLEKFKRVVHDELPEGLPPMGISNTTLILFLKQLYLSFHSTRWILKRPKF